MFFITFISFYCIVYFLLGFIFSSNKETKPIFDQNDKDEEELEKDVLNNSFNKTYYFTSYDEDDEEEHEESYYSYEEDNEDTFLDYYIRSQIDITSLEYWAFGTGAEEN